MLRGVLNETDEPWGEVEFEMNSRMIYFEDYNRSRSEVSRKIRKDCLFRLFKFLRSWRRKTWENNWCFFFTLYNNTLTFTQSRSYFMAFLLTRPDKIRLCEAAADKYAGVASILRLVAHILFFFHNPFEVKKKKPLWDDSFVPENVTLGSFKKRRWHLFFFPFAARISLS